MKIDNNNKLPKMYDIIELSEMLHVTPLTIKRYLKNGRMQGVKIGRKWYVSENNLSDFLNGKQPINIPLADTSLKSNL